MDPLPVWSMCSTNIDAVKIADYLVNFLKIDPITVINTLLTKSVIAVDGAYTVVTGTPLHWETRHAPTLISAPLLIFRVATNPPSPVVINYLFTISGSRSTPMEQAVCRASSWIFDMMYNAPIIDHALRLVSVSSSQHALSLSSSLMYVVSF
jgi:hypothetical protein